MKNHNSTFRAAVASAAIGWMLWSTGDICHGQNSPTPAGLSPDLQEVVKLSQAKMPDDVIKNFVISTGKSYRLSADDIIYLNSQGVSAGVISALQTAVPVDNSTPTVPPPAAQPTVAPAPVPAPVPASYNVPPSPSVPAVAPGSVVATPPPPPEVNFQYFHDQLAPYGAWVNINGVTYWRPDQAVAVNPDWRPYYDMGQWVETENGLYWQSDYTWGDIPFHYGRWVLYPGMGWLWAPDYTWGPAWVFWRQDEADAAIGWAPLPVGAIYVNGGFMFNGVAVGLDFDFGLGEACFTFVGYDHFHEGFFRLRGHEWAYHIGRERIHGFYGHSVLRNEFRRDENGRFVNNGIGRERIEHLTHVQRSNFEERNPVGDRSRLAASRPMDFHGKPANGAGTDNPGNKSAGNDKSAAGNKTANANTAPPDQNFGGPRPTPDGAGKVFRPPTMSPGATAWQSKQAPGQNSGQQNKKKQ